MYSALLCSALLLGGTGIDCSYADDHDDDDDDDIFFFSFSLPSSSHPFKNKIIINGLVPNFNFNFNFFYFYK